MKINKLKLSFIFLVSLFIFPIIGNANYITQAIIRDGEPLCDIRLTEQGYNHSYPISGKCFYANENLNSVKVGVLFLDTGDTVEVITDKPTIPSNDANKCKDYYVYARYSTYYGYFCNNNLSSGVLTEELKTEFKEAGFPESYHEKLAILKTAHPNWTFKAVNTGLDFNEAVNGEVADIQRNLMQVSSYVNNIGYLNTAPGSFNYKTDTFRSFDGSNWFSANKETVAYYMDPRNFLIDMYVFQFESLSYDNNFTDESLTTVINSALAGDYLATFTKEFIEAGKTSLVSPIYLASLSKQEVSNGASPGRAINGEWFSYGGVSANSVYNFYNIGATAGNDGMAVYRGLVFAYNNGWTTPALAITGGATFVGKEYVNVGQNTSYFKKWDVVSNINPASGTNYTHQYMQNIQAPTREAETTYRSYSQSGLLNSKFVFLVPVYNNMPATTSLPAIGSPNNYLSQLVINSTAVAGFDGDVTRYNYYLDINNPKIKIEAKAVNGAATISGNQEYNLTKDTTIPITVTAQNGAKRVYYIDVKLTGTKYEVPTNIQSTLNNAGIKNNYKYLSGIPLGKNPNYITEKVASVSQNATVTYQKTNTERDIMATGDKVTVKVGSEEKTYEVLIYGDVNGDGKITAADYAKVKNVVLGNSTLGEVYNAAADVNKDGKNTAADYAIIKNTVLGNRSIEQ